MICETRCQISGLGVTVFLNGESREIPQDQTIAGLLETLGLDPGRVAVELDGAIVGRAEWAARVLAPGARLEVVHFVGGG
jgi:thiamine biosynthesis protein ThiS